MRSEPPIGDELARLLESMKTTVLERTADEPAAASRGPIAKRVTGIVLGIAALLGLGAGAAFAFGVLPGGGPAPSAPPEPPAATAPSPAASVPPVEYEVTPGPPPGRVQPASAYAIGCAELASPVLLAEAAGAPVFDVDPIVQASGLGIAIPRTTSAISVGGLSCAWSNGLPINDQYSAAPGAVSLNVVVLPRPTTGWSDRATLHGAPRTDSSCGGGDCTASRDVGGSWIEFWGHGIDETVWPAFVDAVTTAVADAGAPSAPSGVSAGPSVDCSAYPGADEIATAAGVGSVVAGELLGGGGGWGSRAEAGYLAGDSFCQWSTDASVVGAVSRVGDGRWAYERMLLAGRSEPVTIPGIAPGDEATLRCDDRFGDGCAVDLAIGDDWLNVYGRDRATAIAVAEAVVAHGVR